MTDGTVKCAIGAAIIMVACINFLIAIVDRHRFADRAKVYYLEEHKRDLEVETLGGGKAIAEEIISEEPAPTTEEEAAPAAES